MHTYPLSARRNREIPVRSALIIVALMAVLFLPDFAFARPSAKNTKSSDAQIQAFLRQTNVFSNIEFFYTDRGVLFNAGNGQAEGCFWPRGSGDSYIFGEGLWFATEKELQGKLHKLCELGYNPNSGAGWYLEGEANQVGLTTGSDGSTPASKYISYVGPRYDKTSGIYLQGSSSVVPSPQYDWPLWDTSSTKTINHNFYFGDYISDVSQRGINGGPGSLKKNGATAKPVITSEEDILNLYTDQDPSNNPEYVPGTGYPFGIDIQEEIYSWSFGRYRDMIFLRHKVFNNTNEQGLTPDTLYHCWMAPAFDPDLDAAVGGAANDANSYVDSTFLATYGETADLTQLSPGFASNPAKLNMGVQWRNYTQPPDGQQYGWIGFSFLESPVIDANGNIVANDDSVALGGYGPNSLFQKNQLGLVTFKDWVIANDPSTQDLRYNFLSSGEKDGWNGVYGDQRLMMATGPFTLPPGKSVETTVGIAIAQVDNSDYKKNFGALLLLTDFAHQVFGEVDSNYLSSALDSSIASIDTAKADTTWKYFQDTTYSYFVNHFVSPAPPNIPNLTTTALDKAVLLTWDSTAEKSTLNVLPATALLADTALPFLGYQLWRSTRSDHDSTIRPDGNNPDVMLGQWQLWNYNTDSVFDAQGHFNHFHYVRSNSTPNTIPHSYLDVGDDNHDGILTGTEGLFNNVTYYYYLLAYNEYDSLNQVGPLYTAIVPPRNFVPGTPNKPPFLVPFASDTVAGIDTSCLSGGEGNPNKGGVLNVQLQVIDTGIFEKLFTGVVQVPITKIQAGNLDTIGYQYLSDTINVSFQPRWTEYSDDVLDQSPMYMYVDITDTRNGVTNTYATMQNAAASTSAYKFPITLPGTIVYHVDGTYTQDSVFEAQFTTNDPSFEPNQTIDQAFDVLANVNLEQLSAPYRLSKVSVDPAAGHDPDPNILRLSWRTDNSNADDTTQNIFNLPGDSAPRPAQILATKQITIAGGRRALDSTINGFVPGNKLDDTIYSLASVVKTDTASNGDTISVTYLTSTPVYHYSTNSTRPSFQGALGQVTYQMTFLNTIGPPGPVPVVLNGTTIYPQVDSIQLSIAGCDSAILRHVKDTSTDMTTEYDWRFYHTVGATTGGTLAPAYNDPDTLIDPNPGWFMMTAYHYADQVPFNQVHTNASFFGQLPYSGNPPAEHGTIGPYYFPIGTSNNPGGNIAISGGDTQYHLTVHRLSVGGAEIIFNAPEIPDNGSTTGDTIAGTMDTLWGPQYAGGDSIVDHTDPHMSDFQPGDKVLLAFTGLMQNLPFPGAKFSIKTPNGNAVSFSNPNNYVDSILAQVQVVPNPYIVTNLAQTQTDEAKLFFTRLPPRCTIEIYSLDGSLVNTIEHVGYQATVTQATNHETLDTSYNYNQLADQSTVQVWNLLTSGQQLVGSQVLFARVIAKDPNSGAEIGEVTTKFAVIVGLTK